MAGLTDIYKTLSTEALNQNNLSLYVDLTKARGDDPIKPIKHILSQNPKGREHILFSGYTGCGKSTELNKLQSEIADKFIIVNYSVLKELDPINIYYVELFIITMEKLFDVVKNNDISISKEFIKSIQNWTQSEEIEEIRHLGGDLDINLGIEVKAAIPLLSKFFGKLRAAGNASYNVKRTITNVIERRLSELIKSCNDFIREIQSSLPDDRGLLIIIEDLDKLSLDKAEELFFTHSHTLTSLNTHIIFTFPISLRYHPKSTLVTSNFTECFDLPMVKIRTKQGEMFDYGRNAIFDIIHKRIGIESFENKELVYKFIDNSGGCLRDLFRMIRNAADNAFIYDRNQITEADYRKGYLKLKRDYENAIAEKRDNNNNIIISVDEYFKVLVSAATSKDKRVNNTLATLDLRQNLCILGYNDEGWCDVHPLVRAVLHERELIQ